MLQNLQNLAKFQNFQLDNLVDFEKCCRTRIYLQRSAPIQPKTSEICRKFGKYCNYPTDPHPQLGSRGGAGNLHLRHDAGDGRGVHPRVPRAGELHLSGGLRGLRGSCHFLAKFRSFSAVSTPIFARKYACFSIFSKSTRLSS